MNEESRGEIVIYRTKSGKTTLEVELKQETVWLNLNQMADLFERDKSVISRHIHNIYREGELMLDSTVAKFATVQGYPYQSHRKSDQSGQPLKKEKEYGRRWSGRFWQAGTLSGPYSYDQREDAPANEKLSH